MAKRYFWLKLKDDFFEKDEVKVIESMPNGEKYINFYLKLILKSVCTEGRLMFRNLIPYTPEMLSTITRVDVDTVKVAIDLFSQLGLMEIMDDGALFMTETQNMIGSESDSAERVRKMRANKKEEVPLLQCNDGVTNCNTDIDIELDKDIKIDIDKKKETNSSLISEIVSYLNSKTNKHYKFTTSKTKTVIGARVKEGFKFEDFKTVIDKKTKQWLGNDMDKYLRPETLFGTKFESYLNESETNATNNTSNKQTIDQSEIDAFLRGDY